MSPTRIVAALALAGWALSFPASTAGAAQLAKSHPAAKPSRLAAPVGSLRGSLHNPGESGDHFGNAVAKSGNGVGATILIGAPTTGSGDGAAYIYVKGAAGWPATPTATLADPAAPGKDGFGGSAAVSGGTAIVGSPGAFTTSRFHGAAYIYVKGASGWPTTPTATLADPAAAYEDAFGDSVAVSGDTAIVGSPGTDGLTGAAYIYVKGTSGWPATPTATLTVPTGAYGFGGSVAVSGDTAVVGAGGSGTAYIYVKGTSGWPTTPTATLTGEGGGFGTSVAVSGDTAVVGSPGAGTAYIYVEGASGWPTTPTATLTEPGSMFGSSVAVSGDTAVVGVGEIGNEAAGAAYIIVRGASGWPTTPTATLTDPSAHNGDHFGTSVAVTCGGMAVVGSRTGVVYLFSAAAC